MRTLGDLTLCPSKAYNGDLTLYEEFMKEYKASKVTKRIVYPDATQA